MSSPVQDDRDKRAMYVPPWARDEMHDEETRRIHAEILEAAERLKPPAPLQRPTLAPDADFSARLNAGGGPDASGDTRDDWQPDGSGRESAAVPEPHEPRLRRSPWSTLSRLAGVAGFAAVVALFVTGAIPLPAIDVSLSRDHKDANAAAPSVAAIAGTAQKLAPAAQPPAPPKPMVAAAPPAASPFPAPPKPVIAEPVAPKPPSVLPEARVLDFMSREEIDGLVKRGQDLIGTGDISGGRLLLTRAAEAGDARASFALAATYDSAVVATLGVVGAFPDPVKARAWYAKAAEQGSPEAARRLEQPHLRQR
jgi:hypothetical protein